MTTVSSLFGVHVPELQLGERELRVALGRARLAHGETYIELGSGHGTGLILAARDFGARAIGVEYVVDAIDATRRRAAAAGVDVEVVRGDLLRFDPSPADVVFLHLGPAFHDVLAPQLERVLGAHTRVVTWGWQVPGWLPVPEQDWGEPDDGEQWPCWLYRPSEPRQQICFQEQPVTRTLPVGSGALDTVEFVAGADLTKLEVRIDGDVARHVAAQLPSRSIGRGQRMLIELEWSAAEPGSCDGALTIWGHSSSGRFTQRGRACPIALQVPG